jgi:tRNA-specific 2-thiouridylase
MARNLGADCLATGHYVRRVMGAKGPELHRAASPDRDQSYFLFATTRAQLEFLRFPLGGLPKDEVRALAAQFGLKVAAKPDSQDICFVPSGSYTSVVEKLRPGAIEPGEIVHVDGRVMGTHDGIIRFTVGQRRGLKIATGEPLFVVGLDAPTRRVFVGPREALAVKTMTLKEVNWLGDDEALDGRAVHVRVRSTRPPVPGTLRVNADKLRVVLDDAEEGVAPGQAAVFYEGSRVLGGGWIAGTERAWAPSQAAPAA